MPPEPLKSEYWLDMYATRLALVMEIEPHSNKYRQILLTKEQFNILSKLMFELFSDGKNDENNIECNIRMSKLNLVLPDWIKDHD